MTGQEIQTEEAREKMARKKPVCGKCGSGMIYDDRDPVNGARFLACMICGNRYPGGPAPVLIGKPEVERKAPENFVPARPLIEKKLGGKISPSERSENMSACEVGHCNNCKRDGVKIQTLMGMCHQCIQYATGTRGEERTQALRDAAKLYRNLKPGERAPYGAVRNKKVGAVVPMKARPKKEGTATLMEYQGPVAPDPEAEKPPMIKDFPEVKPEITAPKEAKFRNTIKRRLDLSFLDADLDLYAFIIEEARKNRRTPNAQAMFLLDRAMQGERGEP